MTTATKARPRDKPTKRATIVEAMDGVFAAWFAGGASWDGWRAVLKAMDGLPMSETEVEFFKSIAGGCEPPSRRVSEFVAACARRTGKDSIGSLVAAHSAALFDGQDKLRPGERAQVLCLACDRDQAKIILRYIKSYFETIPALRAMVERETKDGFELNNGVDITVATNSFRSVRGRPILLAISGRSRIFRIRNQRVARYRTLCGNKASACDDSKFADHHHFIAIQKIWPALEPIQAVLWRERRQHARGPGERQAIESNNPRSSGRRRDRRRSGCSQQ